MTREEAIEYFKMKVSAREAIGNDIGTDYEAYKIALAALRGPTREQVEKVWRGEWEDMREAYKDVPKRRCSRCKNVFIGLDTPFCEVCGAPMTDEAVQMVMERLEALHENIYNG